MVVKFLKNHFDKIIFAISLILLIVGIVFFINSKNAGKDIAEPLGILAGKALGSLEGVSQIDDGFIEGKAEGLSAKDTEVTIKGGFEKIERLQVLVAGIKENHIFSIGDDYKALFVKKADVVFTVDLSDMTVEEVDPNTIIITISMPTSETFNETIEQVAEYQKATWSGTANDGSTAMMNSEKELSDKIQEAISTDSDLMQQAMDAAVKQVKTIAENANINNAKITVEFRKEND